MDVLDSLETGEKYTFEIPEIGFKAEIPFVIIPNNKEGRLKIASFNLMGMIEWNQILGRAIARRIREVIGDLEGVVLFTVVEKALQLVQVVAEELGIKQVAIAYNRIKPHMETDVRPSIQVGGATSITSGVKFLTVYERDFNLLAMARRGVVIIDDVVSTGGTIAALATILDQVRELRGLPQEALRILGVFCIATEGEFLYKLSAKVHSLGRLPDPVPVP
ncbi:MAG: phosphoribosyltransferase family protein [bacterium]